MILILALLIGGGAIVFGVMTQRRHNALKQTCTVQTSGAVARIDEKVHTETYEDEEEEDEERKEITRYVKSYYPVFEYSAGGRVITKTGSNGSNKPRFQTGERVTIFYNPNAPDEFYVAEDTSGSKLSIILIAVGAVIILAGIILSF